MPFKCHFSTPKGHDNTNSKVNDAKLSNFTQLIMPNQKKKNEHECIPQETIAASHIHDWLGASLPFNSFNN